MLKSRMKSKKYKFYAVRVTGGDGIRRSVGRFRTKTEALRKVEQIKRTYRTSADTKNPRISSYMGFN